jgi:protein-tyrosine phosphatase
MTSETHPIRVDWLPTSGALGAGGAQVGLTFAPGKKAPSLLGGPTWRRDLLADLTRLRDE